jgi:hypothetical protein
MRRTLALILTTLFALPAWAGGGAPITERSTPVRQRAMSAGYGKTLRLINTNNALRNKLGLDNYSESSLKNLADELEYEYSGGQKEAVTQQEVETGESNWRGAKKTRTVTTYGIKPEVLSKIKRDTAAHPDLAAAGEKIAEEYAKTADSSRRGELRTSLKSLIQSTPTEMSTLVAQRGRMQKAEAALVGKLDARFVGNLPKLLAALQSKPPEALAEYAVDLVHKINAASSDKQIREVQVAHGESHSSSSGSGYLKGPLGGDRGQWSSRSSSSSTFDASELVLDGSDYTVRVKHSGSGQARLADKTAVGLVEARQIAEMSVEVVLITRALEKRAPRLAAPLSGWLNHSRIDFVDEGGHTVGVELSRADSDVPQKLVTFGVVSHKFASALEKETKRSLGDRMEMHPLLDE